MMIPKKDWILTLLIWMIGAQTAAADDTDILGAYTLSIKPNVLIIFDTSGSMATEDIPEDPYDAGVDYTTGGGYDHNLVYRWTSDEEGGRWSMLASRELLGQTCRYHNDALAELDMNGQAWIRINKDAPYDCGEDYEEVDLRTGNFLNYESGGYAGPMRKRIDTAKAVVKQLIEDHPDVRFGLMRFTPGGDRGIDSVKGGALSENGDINGNATADHLKADIDGFSAEGQSPLAEVLAEAGLYFAGQQSWFNNRTYASPIDNKCRPNVIILMTDGDATHHRDPRLNLQGAYIHGGTIGDFDGDGKEEGQHDHDNADYLDDVAMFLFQTDLMPNMGTGDTQFETQNIQTHTIGFKKRHKLLKETAVNGGGTYTFAGSFGSLARAFEKILNPIKCGRQVYAPPSVPINKTNNAYAGEYLYMGLFDVGKDDGRWRGNLKKYRLDPFGSVVDQKGTVAVDENGLISTSARSFWSPKTDGDKVTLGGAGALLVNRVARKIYTYTAAGESDLTADANAFSVENLDYMGIEVLGVANEDERKVLINNIHGIEKDWVMGDVLHWTPRVVPYDTNGDQNVDHDDDAVIFVGTNGGVLHAFSDKNGEELWGFIPPHQLGRLKLLSENNNRHPYFIDGFSKVMRTETNGKEKIMLMFGERRGGSNYYALDISTADRPLWLYSISDDIFGDNAEQLGQSWGRPQFATIATGPQSVEKVILLPGGYDIQQDADESKEKDGKGRAVFSVAVDSGELSSFQFSNGGGSSDLTHCIVDLVGVDADGDGITNSIYAPDLGGRMFVFADHDKDGNWNKRILFDASTQTHRKIFFSPDVISIIGDPDPDDIQDSETVGEMIFFGTGDLAHPKKKNIVNRFYAVKNFNWEKGFHTMTDRMDAGGGGDLHDATINSILQGATLEAQQKAASEIKKRMGWFIELASAGEKVVSSPVVYNRTVYFTTYSPPDDSGDDSEIDCDLDMALGEARLYGLDYYDGRSVHSDWSDLREYDPVTGQEITAGGKADRYKIIGASMPTAPVIAIRNGVAMLYVGVGGRLFSMAPKRSVEMHMYYWREL